MSDLIPVAIVIAVLAILGGIMLAGWRSLQRRTPEEKRADEWRAQAQLLDRGYRSSRDFEGVIRHFEPEGQEEWRRRLVRYRALVDAGMSVTGAQLHVIGSPSDPNYRQQLGPKGEEVVARALAAYEEGRASPRASQGDGDSAVSDG